MKYVKLIANFFQGTYAKFGTSANLIREVSLSILTAVAVAVLAQLLTPKNDSPVTEVRDLLTTQLARQHYADSVIFSNEKMPLQRTIDSLNTVIHYRNEQDSLQANAGLSDLDAMRKINGAINQSRSAGKGR